MKVKAKGSNAERELVHLFWKEGWAAARVAGSGSTTLPSPDIIAHSPTRSIVIECKATRAKTQYFTQKEILELQEYAARANAEPWVAVKFNRDSWYFCPAHTLEETGSQHKLSQARARSLGFSFKELLGHQQSL